MATDQGYPLADTDVFPPALGRDTASRFTPETTLPSSPLLRDATDQSSTTPVHSVAHSSRASSIRLSRDSEDLRMNGVRNSELYETPIKLEERPELADESGMTTEDQDEESETFDDQLRTSADVANYSVLSKRADLILANAKRKLNLLEGNLKGARHSLHNPSVPPAVQTELSISPNRSAFAANSSPTASSDEGNALMYRGPRINFAPPRQSRSPNNYIQSAGPSHTRGFSETSVPLTRLQFNGSRALDPLGANGSKVLRRQSVIPERSGELKTVPENEATHVQPLSRTLHERSASSRSGSISSLKELKTQAEELKGRLSSIQEQVRDDSVKRRSLQGAVPPVIEEQEKELENQVKSVENTIRAQEIVVKQLERAGRARDELPSRSGSRAEWHRVLETQPNAYDSDTASSETPDEEIDFDAVLEELEDDAANLGLSHEDRADAFDYEHFILHSGMGNFSNILAERSPSLHSSGSDVTDEELEEKGRASPDEGFTDEAAKWDELRRTNASAASVITMQSFATAAENQDSDTEGSETSEGELDESWPMPPATNGSRRSPTRTDSEAPTPVASTFPSKSLEGLNGQTMRPASQFLEAVMTQTTPSATNMLNYEDQERLYSLAECLQEIASRLRDPETDPFDKPIWRARLEEARRILSGQR